MAEVDFQEYVAEQTGRLLRLAYLLTGNRHAAEDLVQEALLRCHRRWDRVSRMDSPDAYVRRALVNQHLSWRRRRSSSELSVAPELLPTGSEPDSQEELAVRDLMRRALRELPRSQRTVLVLRYYEGLADADIADLLGCSAGNVRGLASRAFARLRGRPELTDFVASTPASGEES